MSKQIDLTEGNIVEKLVKLSLPIMGTAFIQIAYSLIDMIWVGKIGSKSVYINRSEVGMYSVLDNILKYGTYCIVALFIMLKKVDLNSVQKNITNISKALGLVQSLITKDEINTETYTPRPLYKKFED